MPSVNGLLEESVTWEYHSVTLNRVPGYGFGIAVSGGRDNPHFANGDPAIAISDVLKGGPADHKLLLNDRILSANGISLENVDYATAIQVLRDNSVVQLVIKRRIVLHSTPTNEYDSIHLTLNRNTGSLNTNSSKKYTLEDYGVQIAAQLIITTKHRNLQVGDIITSVNNNSIENKSIHDLKKIMQKSNLSKLDLIIKRRKPTLNATNLQQQQQTFYTNENLYVQPPRRATNGLYTTNPNPSLDIVPPPIIPGGDMDRFDSIPPPPRPPLPVEEDLGNSASLVVPNGPDYNYLTGSIGTGPEYIPGGPRLISFHKKGSVGIRLAGGNSVGIFVTAVQPNSPASVHLQPGDCILSVNNIDLINYTREEAVTLLMSLNNKVNLKIIPKLQEYNHIIENNIGDSFYIRTHFDYIIPPLTTNSMSNELEFKNGDVFHVTDTLFNGTIGHWEVVNINTNEKGIILNKKSAKVLYNNLNKNNNNNNNIENNNKTLFFIKRKNKKFNPDEQQYFECYEKVIFKHPNFKRPIILFGPISDIARERLGKDFSHEFIIPALDSTTKSIKLTQIRGIIDKGKHGLLDVNPSSVNKLNYAGIHPIIIFLRIDNKLLIKSIRANNKMSEHSRLVDTTKKSLSTRQLFEESIKFEKNWSHLITSILNVTNNDTWFRELKELIENEQRKHIWMSDEMSNRSPDDDSTEQYEMNGNLIEDYLFTTSYNSNSIQHYDTLPHSTAVAVHVEEFDRSLTLNQINKLNSDEILLPNYNEPPPYAITSSTAALFPPDQEHIEEIREITSVNVNVKVKKKEKERETYNGHATRMSNKLNYIPVLAHSPIIPSHSPFKEPQCPPKPPKIDRTKKPRTATERLFGDNSARNSVTPDRNGGGMIKSMIHDKISDEPHEAFYDNHHSVYRYTRPPPPNLSGIESYESLKSSHYGQIYPPSSPDAVINGHHNEMNKDESPYTIFNTKTLDEMKPSGSANSFKLKLNHNNGQSHGQYTDGIYNNTDGESSDMTTISNGNSNGRGTYSHRIDSNDNPYLTVQQTNKNRLAGMKPIPPPKPAKPIRSDLYSKSSTVSNNSNGFYLNVPINLGNREQSAFELYRKAKRDGSSTSTAT